MAEFLKHSDALKAVKNMLPVSTRVNEEDLWDSPYICDNINNLRRRGVITTGVVNDLVLNIKMLLNHRFSLTSWLVNNGYVTDADLRADYDGVKLQRTRQLWLDSMIAEYEAKGM